MGPELLVDQLTYNQYVVKANLADLTHEDSLAAPAVGGNCLNWVFGHVVTSRNGLLQLLGCEPVWSPERAAPYSRGSEPLSAGDAVALDDIVADYNASQETLLAALGELSDDDLRASTSMRFFKGDAETVGSAAAAFVFHEAYHLGQTGILRRVAGQAGAIQ